MEIKLSNEAIKWFKDEMEVQTGDWIRFYARYGGVSPFHEGFSLGMNREQPHEVGIETIIDDIHFFIEKADEWFFNDHNLIVNVDQASDGLNYSYEK